MFKPSPESRESDFAANASPVKQSEPNEAQTQQVKNEKPESKEAVSDKTPAAYAEPNNAEPKVNETSQDKNREIKSDEVFENWAEVVDILSRTSPALTGFLKRLYGICSSGRIFTYKIVKFNTRPNADDRQFFKRHCKGRV